MGQADRGSRGPGFKSRQPEHRTTREASGPPSLASGHRRRSRVRTRRDPGGSPGSCRVQRGSVGCRWPAPAPPTGRHPVPSCPLSLERGCARSTRTSPGLPTAVLTGRHGWAKPRRTFGDIRVPRHGLPRTVSTRSLQGRCQGSARRLLNNSPFGARDLSPDRRELKGARTKRIQP